ncbi:MAG: EamA family transporter [Acidobacteria bacterium]|nr:EamA family transporter [Acidobacteriota bacterium]
MSDGSRRPSAALLYALLTLMVGFWALNFVVARVALRDFPALLAASIRALLAGLILLPLYMWKGRQLDKEPWTAKDVPVLLGLGVIGVTFNQVLFLLGLNRTSTTHAAIITGLMPLQVLIISMFMKVERMSLVRAGGMLVAITGVGVLQTVNDPHGRATLLGDLLIFLSGSSFAAFAVLSKKLTQRHGGLTINTFGFLGGGLVLLPVVAWELAHFNLAQVTMPGWLSIVYMAVFPSAVAYLIFYYALTYIPASRVSTFSYLQPVMATMLGVFLMGDHISSALVAGGSLVLTGVFLTERA